MLSVGPWANTNSCTEQPVHSFRFTSYFFLCPLLCQPSSKVPWRMDLKKYCARLPGQTILQLWEGIPGDLPGWWACSKIIGFVFPLQDSAQHPEVLNACVLFSIVGSRDFVCKKNNVKKKQQEKFMSIRRNFIHLNGVAEYVCWYTNTHILAVYLLETGLYKTDCMHWFLLTSLENFYT